MKFFTPLKLLMLLAICVSILDCNLNKEDTPKLVAILPYYDIDSNQISVIKYDIKKLYDFEVIILPVEIMPINTFVNIKSPRYRADKILNHLRSIKPTNVDYLLALTNKDISFTKHDSTGKIKEPKDKYTDFGIFGLATLHGSVGVVSRFRLGKEAIAFNRLRKIVMHELGHNIGIPHCKSGDKSCLMRDAAESIKTMDQVDFMICENCCNKYL